MVTVTRTRTQLRPASAALGGMMAVGLLLCVTASRTNTLLPQSVRPVRGWMAGMFQGVAFRLHAGELIAAVLVMFACYVVVVWRAHELSARSVIAAVVALNLLVLLAPPLFSTDIFSYQAYARMFAEYGINPYVNGPHTIALDPLYPYIESRWINTPSVYGPLFTLLSAPLAHVSVAMAEFVFKLLAGASSLIISWIVWQSAKLRGVDPVPGLALFGLNPLVVLYGVGGGHNDLLMLLFTTIGVYAVLRGAHARAGAAIAIGTGLKLTGALVAPFAFAASAGQAASGRRRSLAVSFVATSAVVAGIGFAWFGSGLLQMPLTLESDQSQDPWGSIPGALSFLIGGTASHVVAIGFGLLCFGLFVWLLRRVWRQELDWIDAAAWTTVAMLVTASSVLPWYGAWLMPLVPLSRDRRLWKAALILTALLGVVSVAGYVPGGAFFGI